MANDSRYIASTWYNMGINYNEMKCHSAAADCFQKALPVYKRLSPNSDSRDVHLAKTLHKISCTCRSMGQHDIAEEYYQQAVQAERRISQSVERSDIAEILDDMGDNHKVADTKFESS